MVVFTGAGVSVESGIPTFKGRDALQRVIRGITTKGTDDGDE